MNSGDTQDRNRAAPQGVLAGPGTITVIAGLTFAISDERGDMGPGPFGLITDDTRHLSCLQVRLDSVPLRHLGSGLVSPAVARFRGYATLTDRLPDAPVECERLRQLSPGRMTETLTLRCWTPDPVRLRLSILLDADFADIFQVRRLAGDPSAQSSGIPVPRLPGNLRFEATGSARATSVQLDPPPELVDYRAAYWDVRLSRDRPWVLRIVVVHSLPERLARGCQRSLTDLDALSIPDDRDGSRRLLAAGIPWFVALFGRDVLISSYQACAFRPELMLDALAALAARQGQISDPGNEEQPGKILHEVRFGDRPWLGEGTAGGARPYYGSADSTPLFLIMLGEACAGAHPARLSPSCCRPLARRSAGFAAPPTRTATGCRWRSSRYA